MVLGQDTKWITGAAGAVIKDVCLVLKFNLSLRREAGTEPQQPVSVCRASGREHSRLAGIPLQ